jgi:PAS domain S-box-containing protein
MISKANHSEMHLADKLNDASIDRLMAIDNHWEIIAWNKTSEILSGIKKEEALGKHLMEIFPQIKQDADMVKSFELALQGKKCFLPAKAEVFNRSYYENHFIPLYDNDDNGEVIGVMNIMHDVAHRIKAERQLQQLHIELKEKYQLLERASAEMATFTSITGHDLKEPIKKIYTTLEMIKINDGAQLSNSSKAGLRRIQGSLNRINLLLDDILSLSSVTSFNTTYTKVNLHQLLEQVMNSLQVKIKEKGAFIRLYDLPEIEGSTQMLFNLFYNLLDNAIKFQPANNTPLIEVMGAAITDAEKEAHPELAAKPFVCITVSDNGIGFEATDVQTIFTMFGRLHARQDFPGSGIGLTLCQKIASAHGGYITAAGAPRQGATFRCYLPVEQQHE